MDISIVVPVFNEEESLQELNDWIKSVMDANHFSFEVVYIDDGSSDNSWKIIEEMQTQHSFVKAIQFRRNYGKSAALNSAFEVVTGDIVITMDADLQDSPEEIAEMRRMILEDDYDLVSGWKKKRHDPLTKRIPSKVYNRVNRMITGIKLHDQNCGLKAYRKEVVKNIEIYGEMHRFIPVIAKWAGFGKIGEKVVMHQKRKFGVSKFGMERYRRGFLDLISIVFVSRFGKRPMHLFGSLGSILFFIGAVIAGYLAYAKFFMQEYRMTDRPLFYLGLLAMILGTQLFLTGFIAEMMSRNSSDRNSYQISDKIGFE